MEKINLHKIFKNHFQTFRNYDDNSYSITDIFLFFLIPFIFASTLSYFLKFSLITDIGSELITFYSVFGGFMLNILALIYSYDTEKFSNPKLAKSVLIEISSNIAYLISVASLSVVVLFLVKIFSAVEFTSFSWVGIKPVIFVFSEKILIALMIFSLINFCLTIFMVIKRFYSLDSNRKMTM